MLAPSKTILMIGDDALYIYSSGFKGMELIETVPWGAENFEYNVSKIISKDCSGRSVVIVNDMVEQHYRKERVPKVNIMDKKNVVNRKLGVAFPNYPVKAALPLKEKIAKTDQAPAANIYIFAAAPQSEPYQQTMNAARKSLVNMSGYALLPVEAASMVKTLSAKLTPKSQPKSKWAVFIGQHQNGGLRQVVIKDGELALTRMTPVVDSDADPDQWAAEVYQEFQATLSYMARFGFVQEDGLDIMVAANPTAGDILESIIEIDANVYALTASDFVKKLGLSVSSYVDQRYADIIHASWIAKKAKLHLPMQAKEINEISNPRQAAMFGSILLLCGAAYLGYLAVGEFQELQEAKQTIIDTNSRTQNLQAQYQTEVEKKEALGFDIRLVQNSIKVKDKLEAGEIDALTVFAGIGKAIGQDLRLDNVAAEKIQDSLLSNAARAINNVVGQGNQQDHVYNTRIQFSFPSTTDIDRGNEEINRLRDRLKEALPDHEVTVEKYLKDTGYVDELVMDDGRAQQEEEMRQDFVVSISIKGSNS